MGLFARFRENRASIEDPNVPISSGNILAMFGLDDGNAAGETVTIDTALGVPAIFAAVNFLSGTIASLPIHVYRRKKDGRERVKTGIAPVLHDAVNDGMSSFEWRKYAFDNVLTGGRSFTFIERNAAGKVTNLWPLDPSQTTIKRIGGQKIYEQRTEKKVTTFQAVEIVDIPFMLKQDMLGHRSPIATNKETVALAIAATKYGSKFFANGGVPPFAIEGPFMTPGGMQRAAADLEAAVRATAKEKRLALTLPEGHKLHPLGIDPEKSQLVQLQRFLIEQIARIYSLPPTFLQDLTHGTFSNTEQQDLHFVKHTLRRWIDQFEQELNLKLLGRANRRDFVQFNLDGLLRGDFKTRMEGYGQGIQNGVLLPNEARRMENRPDDPSGDELMIQGATVPIKNQIDPKKDDDNGT